MYDNHEFSSNDYPSPLFCEECLERIKLLPENCMNDYIVITEYYNGYKKPLRIYSKHDGTIGDTIKILEKNGFIVSTEISHIMGCVKPIGYIKNEEFYACKKDHLSWKK